MRVYEGRTAVVTGAAGGLGREVARILAQGGAAVACVDIEAAIEDTVAEIIDDGGRAAGFVIDVTDESAVSDLCEEVTATLGSASILMNAAGVLDRRPMAELDGDGFRRVVDINLVGPYLMIRAFSADLIAHGSGRIVNVASIAALTGYAYLAYPASKGGLVSLTRSLLKDFWGTGVTINAVCPGAMDTAMLDQESAAKMVARTPSARIVPPSEVATLMAFLARHDAGSINGAAIPIDGGATSFFEYGA